VADAARFTSSTGAAEDRAKREMAGIRVEKRILDEEKRW
jgi:hypothetical protein